VPSSIRSAGAKLPSLVKEGWTRHQENAAKPPLKERTGWLVQQPIIGGLNEPPRLRPLMWLRDILLLGAATPPLPRRGVAPEFKRSQYPVPPTRFPLSVANENVRFL
jgi:hypothetical protein